MSRAERNLAAANASRARKKLLKAQLIEEKSYLTERNALLRQQLELMPTVGGMYAGTRRARAPVLQRARARVTLTWCSCRMR